MFSYRSPDRSRYRKIQITSRYLTMRDGTKLAVDVYFPQPYDFSHPLPALIHQTRYWRRPEFNRPFKWFLSPWLSYEGKLMKEIVLSGYAFVNVDTRGSGASTGSRAHPWTADEVEDGREVVDWIVEQPWSNGKVGAIGISYTATACEFLSTRQHPAVKAHMPMFSVYDVFADIALPGGVPLDYFIQQWGSFNAKLDRNEFPLPLPILKLLLKGVAPVNGDRDTVAKALVEHEANLNVAETSKGVYFRDQAPGGKVVESMDEFSPHFYRDVVNASGVPFYHLSGWYDGAYMHAAIKRFHNLEGRFGKLILGPWNHGGSFHISPGHSGKNKAAMIALPAQYFDHFLKGYDTGVDELPPVRYFTMEEERWKTADQWPPPGLIQADLFLGQNGGLRVDRPVTARTAVLRHDPDASSGLWTRWRALVGMVRTHRYYPDRVERTRALLRFETDALGSDLEVTGHPLVELFVRSQEEDGAFFVYLDDVLPNGEIRYITEGMLRGIFREEAEDLPYSVTVPARSYLRDSAKPLDTTAPNRLLFDLFPTSYLFRKGHRIRLSFAMADKDNFGSIGRPGAEYGLMYGGELASRLILPVMPREEEAEHIHRS